MKKKQTTKEEIKKLEGELKKDEGAWLKSLGELGDLARLLMRLQEDQIEHTKEIAELSARLKNLREELNDKDFSRCCRCDFVTSVCVFSRGSSRPNCRRHDREARQ